MAMWKFNRWNWDTAPKWSKLPVPRVDYCNPTNTPDDYAIYIQRGIVKKYLVRNLVVFTMGSNFGPRKYPVAGRRWKMPNFSLSVKGPA